MSKNEAPRQTVTFTSTEKVSLPIQDSLVMGIRSRDWQNLRRSVEKISGEINKWELSLTISSTVFFSFLFPAITTPGNLDGWKLAFWIVTVLSLGFSIASLMITLSIKESNKTERADVIELMDDIQSLYNTDSILNNGYIEQSNYMANQGVRPPDPNEDILYEEAKKIAYDLGKVSSSLLQRKMRLGYARAARIVERMERDGIASPQDGAKPRTILR